MNNPSIQLELWRGAWAGPQKPIHTYRLSLGGKRVKVPGAARLKGDRRCKECGHFLRKRIGYAAGRRTYFKCVLIGDSGGPGTDKRANDPACELFEEARR